MMERMIYDRNQSGANMIGNMYFRLLVGDQIYITKLVKKKFYNLRVSYDFT